MHDTKCDRCGGTFGLREDHTKIVRRDFREQPQPATVEHLCGGCWRTYVEEFLGKEWQGEAAAEHV
jgi:ribosomal protein L37AE/L43A